MHASHRAASASISMRRRLSWIRQSLHSHRLVHKEHTERAGEEWQAVHRAGWRGVGSNDSPWLAWPPSTFSANRVPPFFDHIPKLDIRLPGFGTWHESQRCFGAFPFEITVHGTFNGFNNIEHGLTRNNIVSTGFGVRHGFESRHDRIQAPQSTFDMKQETNGMNDGIVLGRQFLNIRIVGGISTDPIDLVQVRK